MSVLSSPTPKMSVLSSSTLQAMSAFSPSLRPSFVRASCLGNKQALISLSDKQDLDFLANGLHNLGYSIISTGGTASAIEKIGVPVKKVEELTQFPEMLDGRVKTLHPVVHGGILARRDQDHHMEALRSHGIGTFDVVVVNLYPFYEKVSSVDGIEFEDGIENIDIGGPTLIRAAAKNHMYVLTVVDSKDYPSLLEFIKEKQENHLFRRELAWKAFQHVASYDSAVSEWLWKQTVGANKFPPSLTIPLSLKSSLRYGENPHQKAVFYADKSLSLVNSGGIATALQHHGKEMSYNNYLDADAAWNCVSEFKYPTCVVVKHTNPCGVASRGDILEAYRLAVKGDPVSAFGGIVAFNTEVDEVLAREIREYRSPTDGETRMFYEIVIAPKYSDKGLEILRGKSKNLRILEAQKSEKGMLSLKQVGGGWLVQESDDLVPADINFNVVSKKIPTEEELSDAEFAWLCVKHVKSNAIVIAKNNCMLGMGSGQPNRLESLSIAFRKAGDEAKGGALASDAFFPFAWKDAVEEACEKGNMQAIQIWLQSIVQTKDFVCVMYCLVLVSFQTTFKFSMLPLLCRVLVHNARFLRHNFGQSTLYRKYLENTCLWVEANTTTISILSSNAEIAMGFLLIISIFSAYRNIVPTFMYWNLLKVMYRLPATGSYHRSTWAKISHAVMPYIYRYAMFLNTPLMYIQRWWLQ